MVMVMVQLVYDLLNTPPNVLMKGRDFLDRSLEPAIALKTMKASSRHMTVVVRALSRSVSGIPCWGPWIPFVVIEVALILRKEKIVRVTAAMTIDSGVVLSRPNGSKQD